MRVLTIIMMLCCATVQAEQWNAYPAELPQFDYSGSALQENWAVLTQGPQQAWPDETFLGEMLAQYPKLATAHKEQAQAEHAHPALKATLEDNFVPLAEALQNVWRLHFEGKYQAAYEQGMQLGPIGAIPGLYAKMTHTSLLVDDEKTKLKLFRETAAESKRLLPLAPDYPFAEFGLLYAQARILEILDTASATGSGFLGSTQDGMRDLAERFPHQGLYFASLGAIQAGVVSRVGSMIGRMTYGATEKRAVEVFDTALTLQTELPVMHFENAVALSRLSEKKYKDRINELLTRCASLPVFSAEEAFNRFKCANWLEQRNSSKK